MDCFIEKTTSILNHAFKGAHHVHSETSKKGYNWQWLLIFFIIWKHTNNKPYILYKRMCARITTIKFNPSHVFHWLCNNINRHNHTFLHEPSVSVKQEPFKRCGGEICKVHCCIFIQTYPHTDIAIVICNTCSSRSETL